MNRRAFIAGLGGLNKAMIAAAVFMAAAAYAQSTSTRLGCDGQLIEPTSKATSPKALQLTIRLVRGRSQWTLGAAILRLRSKATTTSNSNSRQTNSSENIFITPATFSSSTNPATLRG
jgi:hypothetical protein